MKQKRPGGGAQVGESFTDFKPYYCKNKNENKN
jgi:hypothetical protein